MTSRAKRRFERDVVTPLEGQMQFKFVEDEEFANGYDSSKDEEVCTGEADCQCPKCKVNVCF